MVADRGDARTGADGVEFSGVYIISVAARLLEMHPQTLRKYERVGLVQPSRTGGQLRLYSNDDLLRLRYMECLGANDESALQAFHVSPVLVVVQCNVPVAPGAGLQVKSHLPGSYFVGKRYIRHRIRYENQVLCNC